MVKLNFLEKLKSWKYQKEHGSQSTESRGDFIHHRTVLDWVPNNGMEYETMSAPPFDIADGFGEISRWNFYLKVDTNEGNNRVGVFLHGAPLASRKIDDGETANKIRISSLNASFNVKLVHPTDPSKTKDCACPINDYMEKKRWGVANIVSIDLLKDYAGADGKITFILDFFKSKTSGEVGSEMDERRKQIEIMEQKSYEELVNDLLRELQFGSNHDCQVQTSDGQKFKAHKIVLSARSKLFAEELRQVRENQISSSHYRFESGLVTLEVNRPSTVMKIVLCHMYSGHLEGELLDMDKHPTEYVREIVEASEEHGLPRLKEFLLWFRPDLKDSSVEEQEAESREENEDSANRQPEATDE